MVKPARPALHSRLATEAQKTRILHALSLAASCVAVAAANLLQHRMRLLAALSGIAVALLLLLLQIAILEAARAKVTALYDDFNFDLAILPDTYEFLLSSGSIDRVDLEIARATGDVLDTYGLNVENAHWTELPSKQMTYNFLIGLDEPGSFVCDPDIRAGWPLLRSPHAILADRYSQPSVGPVAIGTDAEIAEKRVHVVGQFRLGLFFYAEGGSITRNVNFSGFTGRDPRLISIGLLRLKPGVSPDKARADLIQALPSDTVVVTRDQLLHDERAYFLSTKPVGIMLYISMIIACLVGAAIIVQVLSTEVSNRMNEYAVFKAMGADLSFVYGIGMAQAGLLGLGALLPATVIGAAILAAVASRTHLDTIVGPSLMMTMFAIALALSVASGAAVVSRVQRADPAELY